MICAENLVCTFMRDTPFAKTAVKDVSFTIADGSCVGIVGGAGAGKSTLLKLVAGILRGEEGKLTVNGLDLTGKKLGAAKIAGLVTTVFQNPEHQFFAETVREELAFGLRNLGKGEEEINLAIAAMLPLIGLDSSYLRRSPFKLSGGEMRRVALASILLMDSPVILLDEPTSGLDPQGKRQITAIIRTLTRRGKTILWVGHDLREMAGFAQGFLVMAEGKLLFDGTPEEVLADPALMAKAGLGQESVDLAALLREKYGLSPEDEDYRRLMRFFKGEEGMV